MKTLIFIVVFFVLLLVFIGAFTQTSWFRSIVASQLESLVESNTNGRLTIGRIEGNFISGFTIHDAHLKLRTGDSTDLVSMNELYARYSLWQFISGTGIPVTTLVLRTPTIRLQKLSGDSLWNFQRLLPSKPSQGPSAPFDLTIDIQNLRIEDGKLFVHDYNAPPQPTSSAALRQSIDWGNIELQNVDLDMRAHIQGEKKQRVQIDNLSFVKTGSDPFILHHLELGAIHDDLHTELNGVHLITSRSDIRLTALMDPLQVLNGAPLDSLQHSKTRLTLSASAVSERELKYFLPDLSFLEGEPSIEMNAEGEFGKLKITKGRLGFRKDGNISFSGEIRNLHSPEHLYLDVALKARSLSDQTLRNYVPGLEIADMKRFGTVNIEKLTFTGYTDNFSSNFDIRSTAGTTVGKGSLDLRSKEIIYNAQASTKNVDLATLLQDPTVKSDLNSSFTIKGRGTNLKTMQAEFVLDGDGLTGFKNYQVEKFHLGGKIGGATLTLENTSIVLRSGASLASVYAAINFSDKVPTYDFDVSTKELPVSDFAPIFPAASKVSVDANLSGSGSSANSLVGSIDAHISGLQQDKKPLPNIDLSATLERDPADQNRRIDIVTSSIADLTFKGKYNIETIGTILADRIQKISAAVKNRGKESTVMLPVSAVMPGCSDSIDLSYTANIKDLRPVAPFIPNVIFLGSGKLNGSVHGCANGLVAFRTDGNIHNFFMRQRRRADTLGVPPMRLRDTKFTFSADHIADDENSMLRSLVSEFTLQSDSIMKISGVIFDRPDIKAALSSGELKYAAGATIARTVGLVIGGEGNIDRPDLVFQPDTLSVSFGKSFIWHNDNTPHITIGADGSIAMDTLSLIKPKLGYDPENKFAQRVKLGFKIQGDSIMYAYVTTPQLDLGDVPKFFPEPAAVPELNQMTGRVSKMNAQMHGTFSHPEVTADLLLRNFTYNRVTLDSGRVSLLYKDLTLSGKAAFHIDTAAFSIESMREGRENFIASGNNSFTLYIDSIPLLFSLSKYPQYSTDSAAVSKRLMSIRAIGKDYPLDMFSPFVPVVADLHGLSDIELTVSGTQENILYNGSVDVRQGSLLLPTTNLYYNISGKLLFNTEEMRFVDMHLANIASDDPAGRGVLNGSFYFKGFDVQSFKLTLSTDRLTVLGDASKKTLKSIYGPLAIRTDGAPLVFSGTFARPKLSGSVVIIDGSLTLPQTDVSSAEVNDGIVYRTKGEEVPLDSNHHGALPDSTKKILRTLAESQSTKEYNDTAFEEATKSATPASAPALTPEELTQAQLSFSDKMLYDLQISIPGNLWFNINLSKLYGVVKQQLVAEIRTDGVLTFIRNEAGADYSVGGTIAVTDKSTYTLVKEFSPVTGTISFIKALDNPSINIAAEYSGQHKTTAIDETIKIKLIVEGTRNDPRLTMELYHKNTQGEFIRDIRPEDQVRADVLTYLTAGYFASDAPGQTNNSLANAGVSVGVGAVTGALNSFLSSYLNSKTSGYIRSIGVEYGGTLASKWKLTGNVKDIQYTLGGGINNASGNYSFTSGDFSVEMPLWKWSSLMVEGHVGVDPFAQGLSQQPLYLGKWLFHIRPQ
ncbi:MAG: translocation/assembly module TamB domain-containing protein [Bacteroidota bacterium]|nr:translocation/assembly module TamB domain-containing protein [Bacteroidota bacterium]